MGQGTRPIMPGTDFSSLQRLVWLVALVLAVLLVLTFSLPLVRADQQGPDKRPTAIGSLEFTARVQPTGGRPEPAVRLAFSLLRKSYEDIQKEAEASEPQPDIEKFIEGLELSPQLKDWMKRNRWVQLSGPDFMRRVKPSDILEVPEFFEAYVARNAGDTTVGFPASRARDADRTRNPAKYERDQQEYREAIRKFIAQNPHTRDGLEVHLDDINPAQRWQQQQSDRRRRVRQRAAELAEMTYLVARAETDFEGRAIISGIPAGDYWLSTLEAEAMAGDVRLRWDVPVAIRAGRVTRVLLSNVNAVRN